jgi:hypothetical protein
MKASGWSLWAFSPINCVIAASFLVALPRKVLRYRGLGAANQDWNACAASNRGTAKQAAAKKLRYRVKVLR